MQRALIFVGLVLVAAGIMWPWFSRLPLARLPGDIRIPRDGFDFYFPLTTGLLISALISQLICLFRR